MRRKRVGWVTYAAMVAAALGLIVGGASALAGSAGSGGEVAKAGAKVHQAAKRGPRGPRGLRGRRGPRGFNGAAGAAGAVGPQGPAGPAGVSRRLRYSANGGETKGTPFDEHGLRIEADCGSAGTGVMSINARSTAENGVIHIVTQSWAGDDVAPVADSFADDDFDAGDLLPLSATSGDIESGTLAFSGSDGAAVIVNYLLDNQPPARQGDCLFTGTVQVATG
jgi:hypothetical protein